MKVRNQNQYFGSVESRIKPNEPTHLSALTKSAFSCSSVCLIRDFLVGWYIPNVDPEIKPPLSGGSVSKESTCNAGDLGSIPGLGRSPEEGNGYPLHYSCLERSLAGYSPWGCKELDTTERLSTCLHMGVVPWLWKDPGHPSLGPRSLSLWTTREVPIYHNFK